MAAAHDAAGGGHEGLIDDRDLPTVWRHDGALALAIGQSRHDVSWRNVQRKWSQLAAKLRQPTRTPETAGEYDRSSREHRAGLKDVGGYVGGALAGGRRTASALRLRQLVVLDIDFGSRGEVHAALDPLFTSFAWIVHTTRSDRMWAGGSDRLRLLVPLSRPVTADEYPAVARRIAGDISIEAFDDSTFEPHRLMYWPSVSADQPFWIAGRDAAWLDVDATLARYVDWRDPREWPVSMRAGSARDKHREQAEDPTRKPGIVGAFCRRYSITDALTTFLGDVYAPHSDERWTYREGSTAGGLVVYDDKWTYSHHGTDPAGGRLLNAWDLVRLHRFGQEDAREPESTPLRDLPSTRKMLAWVSEIPEMREQLASDRVAAAATDFQSLEALAPALSADLTTATAPGGGIDAPVGATGDAQPVADREWMRALELTKDGAVKGSRHNLALILRHDPMLAGKVLHDEMAGHTATRGSLPWTIRADLDGHHVHAHATETPQSVVVLRRWTDRDDAGLRAYLERVWRIDRPSALFDAVELVSRAQGLHPVREYLRGLPAWDMVPRLDSLFIRYLGATDSPYVRAAARKMCVAAVARVMRPGCKWDQVISLAGVQGAGKSSFLRILGSPWHTDSLPSVHGREGAEVLAGTWIVEIAELVATRRAEVEAVKAYITRQVDRYRPAFARRVVEQPRQCIFVGTTNDMRALTDSTGNRRYWPIDCNMVGAGPSEWAADLAHERDQVWAEAVMRWTEGEPMFMTERDAALGALEAQEAHTDDDGVEGGLEAWLDQLVPTGWSTMPLRKRLGAVSLGLAEPDEGDGGERRVRVCAREIWLECMRGADDRWNRMHARRIGEAMDKLPGWVRSAKGAMFGCYGRTQGWVRGSESAGTSVGWREELGEG